MYKEGHCLGTPQACTCDPGIGISTVLEIIGHFLFKGVVCGTILYDRDYIPLNIP
jgi:hypothetical protein